MSRCRDCGATWSGRAVCHCTACHETFTSERAFAMHQGAVEGCTNPATLKSRDGKNRLARNPKGHWTRPGPRTQPWRDAAGVTTKGRGTATNTSIEEHDA